MLAENPGNIKRINKDDLRAMLDAGKWSQANEKLVLKVRDALVVLALEEGKHVVVDDTNLVPRHEERLRQLAREQEAHFEVIDFTHIDVEECIARDGKRPSYVGEKVIREMWQKLLAPKIEPVAYDPKLSDCVLVDIDGTVALMNGRGPFDWHRVHEDLPHAPIIRLLTRLYGYEEIIFVSGRKDVCREETLTWLRHHFNFKFILHMRRADDDRDDVIVKCEIYEREIKGKWNVQLVIDDRSKVVKMWRSLGLTCVQVADGDF